MQADPLGDACGCCRRVEDAAQLAVGKMLPLATARKQPTLPHRNVRVETCRTHVPPLSQRHKQIRREHDVPVLAPFRLHDADDHLYAIDAARFEPDDLADTKPAAIAEGEHHVIPEVVEQPLRLVRAHGEWELLRLLEVVDLGSEIVPPQRDAE